MARDLRQTWKRFESEARERGDDEGEIILDFQNEYQPATGRAAHRTVIHMSRNGTLGAWAMRAYRGGRARESRDHAHGARYHLQTAKRYRRPSPLP